MTKPFFCVVEGIDGCGKTGVVAWLAKHLAAQGRDVIATREPGGTQQGEAIRALILSGADRALETGLVDASPAWLTDLTTRF